MSVQFLPHSADQPPPAPQKPVYTNWIQPMRAGDRAKMDFLKPLTPDEVFGLALGSEVLLFAGVKMIGSGQIQEAIHALSQGVKSNHLSPRLKAQFFNALGCAYYQQTNLDSAIHYFDLSLQVPGDSVSLKTQNIRRENLSKAIYMRNQGADCARGISPLTDPLILPPTEGKEGVKRKQPPEPSVENERVKTALDTLTQPG